MKRYKRWLAKSIYRGILALVITGSFGLSAMAQTVTVGGGLDCNGWSPISHNVKPMICTDPHGPEGGRFYDNGWYIGHDEPDVQFYSSKPGSGNNMVWHFTLPKHDPVPTQSGTSVATFELTPAIWFSLALCDPNSYPQNPCIPDSDRNTGTGLTTDAGNAALELQFYPPGWPPFVTQISCDQTRWCAALTIDSLECNYNFAYCNPNCEEPVNFAFIQDNGVPAGPPAPGQQTLGSFTPNSQTLLMNPGDDIVAIIRDTPQGLLTRVIDLTTGQSGFMVAGAKNGFANTDLTSCKTTSFNFHPEFSTAKTQNVATWTALQANVNFAVETGHFELGASGDGDVDDAPCFPGPTIAGCLALAIGGDLDFDGPPYLPDWPDGSTNHPSTVLMRAFNDRGVGPMTFGSNENDWGHPVGYPKLQFKTDVALSDPGCNSVTGAGCVVPPNGAAFYPFFTQLGKDKDTCSFAFGSDIPGESTNDFGKDAQYGPFLTENTVVYGNAGKVMPNPCNPAGIPGLN